VSEDTQFQLKLKVKFEEVNVVEAEIVTASLDSAGDHADRRRGGGDITEHLSS